jgi:hypothetical protein
VTVPVVTVVGKYRTASGPAAGSVTFTPTQVGVDQADQVILTASPVAVTLDADGVFSVEIVPSDAAGMVPSPILYRVMELFAGASRTYELLIPMSAESVQISDLAPIGDPPLSPVVVYVMSTVELNTAELTAEITAEADARVSADTAEATLRTDGDAATLTSANAYTDVETLRAEAAEALKADAAGVTAALTLKADLVGGQVPLVQIPPAAFELVENVATVTDMLALSVGGKGALVRVADDGGGFPALFLLPAGADPTDEANWVEVAMDAEGAAAAALATAEAYTDTGVATRQLADPDLTVLAGLDSTQAGVVASDGAGWIRKTYAAVKTALALVKADVGLDSVDNVSDVNKPVSTAQAAADAAVLATATAHADTGDALLIPLTQRAAVNGVATLDGGGKVPVGQLPAITMNTVWPNVASQAAMLALAAEPGDVAVRTDVAENFMLAALPASTLANWVSLADVAAPVMSVFGRIGAVTLAKADVTGTGLAAVDVGADASGAAATALTTATGRAAALAMIFGG